MRYAHTLRYAAIFTFDAGLLDRALADISHAGMESIAFD